MLNLLEVEGRAEGSHQEILWQKVNSHVIEGQVNSTRAATVASS